MNKKEKLIYYGKYTILFLMILGLVTYSHMSCQPTKTPWQPRKNISHKVYKK